MRYIKLYEDIDFNNIDDYEGVDDFDGFEDFRNFLEDNGVLDKFIKNFYSNDNEGWKKVYWVDYNGDGDYTLNDFLRYNKKNKSNYISRAFSWSSSPEGYLYWEKVRNKWRKKNNF
jgi:hypothetical protein